MTDLSTCDNINCAEMIEELTAERNALAIEVKVLEQARALHKDGRSLAALDLLKEDK